MIIALAILWYGLVPIAGAMVSRRKWRRFRQRFNELCLRPLLDYRRYRQIGADGGCFRFTGDFESVTDGHTLWIKGEDLTIPVSLANAQTFLLPVPEGKTTAEMFDPEEEEPQRIRWNRISTLTEGTRVFTGGSLVHKNGRWTFVSTRENPLTVIFYDGSDRSLAARTIRAGRSRNEYWNAITPYSLAVGVLCQLLIAISFRSRPAYHLMVIGALGALFIPLYPMIPPGLLFTIAYRRLSWKARILRIRRDLVRLPLEPEDIAAYSSVLPAEPEAAARTYAVTAYALEALAWVMLLAGIGLNIFFLGVILSLL